MQELVDRLSRFKEEVAPQHKELYEQLGAHGQSPKVLMISCADSRVVPEMITHAAPGDLFVCRNAGNIVPPFAQANGGVTSTVEYAVMALGISEIIVCGHSDCGAMKAVANPVGLEAMPNVAAWLRHSDAAKSVVDAVYPELDAKARVRAVTMENVIAQINHLRTHPSVAAALAQGKLTLHGWYFEIGSAEILAYDHEQGVFTPVKPDQALPVAVPAAVRMASCTRHPVSQAAE